MDSFDIFDDETKAPLPAWLQCAMGADSCAQPADGDDMGPTLANLPPELLQKVLTAMPSSGLAAMDATAKWLSVPVRNAALEIVRQTGLVSVPERKLGESWACVVRRAELRVAGRRSGSLAGVARARPRRGRTRMC